VDVNVHPAKLEVRFRTPGVVQALLEESIQRALGGPASGATLDREAAPDSAVVRETPFSPREALEGSSGLRNARKPAVDSQMALFLPGSSATGPGNGDATREELESLAPQGIAHTRPRLWQIHDTYILAEIREGLLIIDQHSAHERVLFQRLMVAFQAGGQESQSLLFPITLRLGPAELREIEALQGLLSRVGFEVEAFGGDTAIVHSVPNPHPYFDGERCFKEMIEELVAGSELVRSAKNQHERIAMTFACKGAVKAGQRLSPEEMSELFDALFETDLPFHDVHGRPTIIRLSTDELERKFGRH
jgi:DNA mismatch repair protein MutL